MRIGTVAAGVAIVVAIVATPVAASAGGTWSAPVVIGRAQADTGYSSSTVATAANGASVAVWSAVQGHANRFLAAYRAPGKAWGAPRVLASNIHDGRIFAGISNRGRATVLWTTAIGSGSVRYAVHTGAGWSANRVVPGTAGFDATTFSTAPNGYGVLAGNKSVKVRAGAPALSIAYVRKLMPSGTWGPARRVSSATLPSYQGRTHAGTGANDVQAAIDTTGSVIAAWGWAYYQDPSGSYTRLQRGGVGAGGKVSRVTNLSPSPTFVEGVESVAMSPRGAAAIAWHDEENKTAYVLTKTPHGPWVSTMRDISSLGIGDSETFVVSDAGLAAYWTKALAGVGSTTVTLSDARFSGGTWTAPAVLDADTIATSDEIRGNDLHAASSSGRVYVGWGTQDVDAFLADKPSTTADLTTVTSSGASTQSYALGWDALAISAGGVHAAALLTDGVPGAVASDLAAVTRS